MAKHFEVMKQRQIAVQKYAHERAVHAAMMQHQQQAVQQTQPPAQSHNQAQQPNADAKKALKLAQQTVDWYKQGGFPYCLHSIYMFLARPRGDGYGFWMFIFDFVCYVGCKNVVIYFHFPIQY